MVVFDFPLLKATIETPFILTLWTCNTYVLLYSINLYTNIREIIMAESKMKDHINKF